MLCVPLLSPGLVSSERLRAAPLPSLRTRGPRAAFANPLPTWPPPPRLSPTAASSEFSELWPVGNPADNPDSRRPDAPDKLFSGLAGDVALCAARARRGTAVHAWPVTAPLSSSPSGGGRPTPLTGGCRRRRTSPPLSARSRSSSRPPSLSLSANRLPPCPLPATRRDPLPLLCVPGAGGGVRRRDAGGHGRAARHRRDDHLPRRLRHAVRFPRRPGEIWPRSGRDLAEIWPRSGRDTTRSRYGRGGWPRWRSGRDVAEIWPRSGRDVG